MPTDYETPATRAVRVGCSGWDYHDWRGELYPEGLPTRRWLEFYAQRFDTVEVNTTFYRLVGRDAVAHWVEQTPQGFVFAVKGSRYLTHIQRLDDTREGVARFFERIEPLCDAGRLGVVLWQLPESFQRDERVLAGFLDSLPAGRHAFEFRHPSWFVDPVLKVLREHDAALVLADHPQRSHQQSDEATADWRYLRFHGGAHGHRGNYSTAELERWAQQIHRWRRTHELFVYFNNDWEAFAPRNALWLRERLVALAAEAA